MNTMKECEFGIKTEDGRLDYLGWLLHTFGKKHTKRIFDRSMITTQKIGE